MAKKNLKKTEKRPEELEEEELYFTNARVVRLIKMHNKGKIIKKRVKVEMNKLLERIAVNISKEIGKKPYSTVNYEDFLEAAKDYLNLEKINTERRKTIATLEKIKEEAAYLITELREKTEEDEF